VVTEYFHNPLRFIHLLRTIWGRGYSGNEVLGETSAAHRVIPYFPSTGFHSPSSVAVLELYLLTAQLSFLLPLGEAETKLTCIDN
jgi:hypothetical protein